MSRPVTVHFDLTFELDLDKDIMNQHVQDKVIRSKVVVWTRRQTDTHTHTHRTNCST